MHSGYGCTGGVLNGRSSAGEKKRGLGGDACCSTSCRVDARVRGAARASHRWTAIVNTARLGAVCGSGMRVLVARLAATGGGDPEDFGHLKAGGVVGWFAHRS